MAIMDPATKPKIVPADVWPLNTPTKKPINMHSAKKKPPATDLLPLSPLFLLSFIIIFQCAFLAIGARILYSKFGLTKCFDNISISIAL